MSAAQGHKKTGVQSVALFAFFVNFSALTLHEMNAISWREWRAFGITDDVLGERFFILAHFPLSVLLLSLCTRLETRAGRIASLVFSAFLVFHLFIHFAARADGYFTEGFGFGLIVFVAITSLVQLVATLLLTPKRERTS